jgi:hypothetical protein
MIQNMPNNWHDGVFCLITDAKYVMVGYYWDASTLLKLEDNK